MNIPDRTIKDCALALVNHYQRLAADFKDFSAAETEYLKISNQLSGIRLVLSDGLMADYVHSSLIGLNKIYAATLRRLRVQQLKVEQEQQEQVFSPNTGDSGCSLALQSPVVSGQSVNHD